MSDPQSNELTFSFVVPVHNEQAALENFYNRLKTVAEALGEPYEVIFVDDGSTDDTGVLLRGLAGANGNIRIVELSRNFGHQWAVTAGLDNASGRAVISLDGDCQHPPELIPELVARWREGFEVVCTIRKDTDGISALRRGIGRLAYGIIALFTGAKITDQADFRLLDRKAVDAIKTHREAARFVRGLVKHIGFRQTSVPYIAERRINGKSSYTTGQLTQMASAGVFNFSLRPLRIATAMGIFFIAAAIGYAAVCLAMWPMGMFLNLYTHLVMLIVGMFGLQFFVIGILGEYVGRTFEQSKGRPLYVVREKIGFPAPAETSEQDKGDSDESVQYRIFT